MSDKILTKVERDAIRHSFGGLYPSSANLQRVLDSHDALEAQAQKQLDSVTVCSQCGGSGWWAKHDGWAHEMCPKCEGRGVKIPKSPLRKEPA